MLGALYEGHVPKYKLLWEGYSDGYVTPNWELSYRKPQHLMTLDERWASYTENKRKGMEHRHAEYMEGYGGNDREAKERRGWQGP